MYSMYCINLYFIQNTEIYSNVHLFGYVLQINKFPLMLDINLISNNKYLSIIYFGEFAHIKTLRKCPTLQYHWYVIR